MSRGRLASQGLYCQGNGKPQNLTYFTSDPFELSVAVVIDTGMSDVALQKVNQTDTALSFSPYDEVALYT